MDDPVVSRLKENILAAQVTAALQGHELGPFEAVDEPGREKYQAFCRRCGKSVYDSYIELAPKEKKRSRLPPRPRTTCHHTGVSSVYGAI